MFKGGGILPILTRLAICWTVSSVCAALGVRFQLLFDGGLAFDLPYYWDRNAFIAYALTTPLIHVPIFAITECWRFFRKVSLPFRAYAMFIGVWHAVQTVILCLGLTGVFVQLWERLNISDQFYMTYVYVEIGLSFVLTYILAFLGARMSLGPPDKPKAATS
ncbi:MULTISPECIES: hypothetical protein [Asticcacaulis]|uniref:hypothetical protein n=1 Tax=Asticcacaulis TaxID=76890 RepID=UPI001AE14EA4|nr:MULTISPECIES: hypothetical protein [Asticcacaulis]MBP2161852.1 hypothetical protein [Asticcacaulis solisilvae]MDR6802906.1 hypothetical protein [Asticcacaulis sp. BE141]